MNLKRAFKMAFSFSIIPKDNPNQAVLLRRFFIGAAFYTLAFFFFCGAYLANIVTMQALCCYGIIIITINILLYVVYRAGLNLRMSDPSLTSIQMCIASFAVMYGLYYLNQARGIFFALYVIILLFGIFRLKTRQFLFISAFMTLTYGVDILLLNTFRPQGIVLKIECVQLLGLAVILVGVSFLGGHLSSLRQSLTIAQRELRASLNAIGEMGIRDDLTGLYNRRHLTKMIELEKERSARSGAVFSLAMIDIDDFKKINDTYGHLAGDQALKTFAAALKSILRKTDFCGRFGGEEFCVVLTQTDILRAKIFAERIRSCIEDISFPTLDPNFKVTVSIGLTECKMQESFDEMLSRADNAMYKAKHEGRNRVECYD
jgi:diguanylate cyclase (GGDEF)-like protein